MNDENKEYIKALEEFKDLLTEWEYGNPTSRTRSDINKKLTYVRSIVQKAGTLQFFTVGPPPAIGGMVINNIDPFKCIFNPPYGLSLNKSLMDCIDSAIGVIETDPSFTMQTKQVETVVPKREEKISNRIFIVHGRDNEIKETTARFLEKLGLQPIILHEQSNKGKTIIEKFEDYADVAFAIVLMTPDDLGKLNQEDASLSCRARQNVIFELGYFLGKLGRHNVAALVKGELEMPSDYSGILFIGIDSFSHWKMALAKEMKTAGIPIDLNKTI